MTSLNSSIKRSNVPYNDRHGSSYQSDGCVQFNNQTWLVGTTTRGWLCKLNRSSGIQLHTIYKPLKKQIVGRLAEKSTQYTDLSTDVFAYQLDCYRLDKPSVSTRDPYIYPTETCSQLSHVRNRHLEAPKGGR